MRTEAWTLTQLIECIYDFTIEYTCVYLIFYDHTFATHTLQLNRQVNIYCSLEKAWTSSPLFHAGDAFHRALLLVFMEFSLLVQTSNIKHPSFKIWKALEIQTPDKYSDPLCQFLWTIFFCRFKFTRVFGIKCWQSKIDEPISLLSVKIFSTVSSLL